MQRFHEFFQNDEAGYSMSRLLMFGSFFITSIVMIYLTWQDQMNEGYFSMYIAAWSGTYLVGKKLDAKPVSP